MVHGPKEGFIAACGNGCAAQMPNGVRHPLREEQILDAEHHGRWKEGHAVLADGGESRLASRQTERAKLYSMEQDGIDPVVRPNRTVLGAAV